MSSGWIGVDLDGTLAHYTNWRTPEHIGPPIPRMVERMQRWHEEGQEVRIFTARAASLQREFEIANIKKWCLAHLGREYPVTASKDYMCIEIWDDCAVQVVPNTGIRADGND